MRILYHVLSIVFTICAGCLMIARLDFTLDYKSKNAVFISGPLSSDDLLRLVCQKIDAFQSNSLATLVDHLKREIPLLRSVSCFMSKNSKICFSYDVWQPLIVCNDTLVGLVNGLLVDKNFFTPDALQGLPTIKVSNNNLTLFKNAASEWINFFDTNSSLVDDYDLVWVDTHLIILHDKKDKGITIRATSCSAFNEKMRCALNHIVGESKKKQKTITIDIRFNDQIIVLGGEGADERIIVC